MADFRHAYYKVAETPAPERPALAGAKESEETLCDRYGASRQDWVYCWKCDMPITLEERATRPCFHPDRGMFHAHCPKPGPAPIMPVAERTARAERLGKATNDR